MAGTLRHLVLLFKYLKDPKISLWSKVLFALPIAYFILPIDLLPDVLFPIGYLEDIGVLIASWPLINRELEKYRMSLQPVKNTQNQDNVVQLKKDDYSVD